MAFNPLYAASPGRPVNLQRFIDPSIVGQQLQATVPDFTPYDQQAGTPKAPGMSGGMYQPTTQDRITGAVSSFGANTDPSSVYAPEAFLGSAARGFAGVKNYLAALAGQHAASQRQAQQDELNRRNIESQIRDRETVGQINSPRIGEGYWADDPTTPGQEIRGYTHPQTGEFVPQTYGGKPFVRPKQAREERIDPYSDEGIERAVRKAREMAQATVGTGNPSESELRAAGLLRGAREAYAEVEDAVRKGFSPQSEPGLSQAMGLLFDSAKWRNALATPVGQQYYNAVERLITNYLYTTSGANANPGEIATQGRQQTLAFFDAPTSREQKMRFLNGKLREMEVLAGRALRNINPPATSGRVAPSALP